MEGGKRNPSISVLGRIVTAWASILRNYFVAHVPDGKESDAATEKPKDQLSRDFGVVRFSTLATISAIDPDPSRGDFLIDGPAGRARG